MTEASNSLHKKKYTRQILLFVAGICLILGGIGGAYFASQSGYGGSIEVWATPVQVSFTAPSLLLNDVSGQPVSLESFQGKVVLLNNWATWCPPCKKEMPDLQRYYTRYHDKDFVLIAIDQSDSIGEVEKFIQQYKLTFPVWMDPLNQSLRAFSNDALPNSYVIDRTGIVRLAWTGAVNDDILEKYVTPLLEEK